MNKSNIYNKVKASTVAIAKLNDDPQKPYSIIGSGCCIHQKGIVITCEHVFSAFMSKSTSDIVSILQNESEGKVLTNKEVQIPSYPQVLFFKPLHGKLAVIPVPIDFATIKVDCDLGIVRLQKHTAFSGGYPYLEIEDYDQIHEGMELATCGFPLGNFLGEQIGTRTSSFTKGILSSIAPFHGCPQNLIKSFQLDLTATHGNSGGPVFSVSTGKVLGVLQGGIEDVKGDILPGIIVAEPVYPLTSDSKFINDLLSMPDTPAGIENYFKYDKS